MKYIFLLLVVLFFSCKENKVKQSISDGTYWSRTSLVTRVYYKDNIVKSWIDEMELVTPALIKRRQLQGDSVINYLKKLGL